MRAGSYLEQMLFFTQRVKDDLNCCRIGATQACTATVEPMARMWRGSDLEIRTLSNGRAWGRVRSQKCENKKQLK